MERSDKNERNKGHHYERSKDATNGAPGLTISNNVQEDHEFRKVEAHMASSAKNGGPHGLLKAQSWFVSTYSLIVKRPAAFSGLVSTQCVTNS